ncbi:serine/threonine protein kinase [Nitzschia inconspicua]|uniref:Serine/threonine protein kinase n=1 Tax=Nitzschia inconspicua TaxID=303405 RepID=A0A9K3KY02_9STRA|nr:serine/threonine protein kinase [Nitzschia inconspicua]
MGNHPVTAKKSGENRGSLHDNLIAENFKLGDKYSTDQDLGAGKATQIKRGQLKRFTKSTQNTGVAIKLYDGTVQSGSNLKTEAMILSQCDHPNIVRLFEVTKVNGQMSLVLELCDGGCVLDRLPYKESQASNIVRQICSAVSYLHSKNMMHRDIECSNILYASKSEDSEVKLVDFGSACELQVIPGHNGAFRFLKEKTGSLHVMAPEVIRGKYGPKADVWSLGCVAYALLNNGEHPIKGQTKDELERKILQGSVDYRGWEHSTSSKNFVQATCNVNAGVRLSAAAALIHPWLLSAQKTSKKTLPIELVTSFSLYRISPPLKRIALNALARKTKSSRYRETFEFINKSHSGIISKEEFMEAFKNSGNSDEELEELFDKVDINDNGGITYTEFIAATLETEGELEEAQLQEAFALISSNGRYITKKDIEDIVKESLKSQNELEVIKNKFEVQMNRLSKNHKKEKIHYEDFAQMFEHGFDAHRSMDAIIETSLNEEQLNRMKEDDKIKHLAAIREQSDS